MQGSPLAWRWVTPLRCSQRAVEMDVGCGRHPKARVHFWTPPPKRDRPGSEVAGVGAGAHGTAHSATSPHCILVVSTCFMLFPLLPPFFQAWGCAGSLGCSQRGAGGWGGGRSHRQRGAVGVSPMSFIQQLQCQPAAARWLLAGAILSPDRWARAGVWVTAMGGVLGGGLRAGKSRWDFSGDSPILPPPRPERFQ